ncbi:hypothetical protein L1887_02795 [Cichorium endivia]|nr:hypothetical protein L1887_02795 [Cichorium endivia]
MTKWTRNHLPSQVIGEVSSGVLTRAQQKAKQTDKLNEFERNKVWRLVPTPENASVLGMKWIFRNKMDKEGNVIRNKARLVVKGSQNFDVYQMDVRSTFLNAELEETVYIEQPPGFVNEKLPDHCYAPDKAVYGLKQAPKAWYETLTRFLKQSKFKQGSVDPTFFRKKEAEFRKLMETKFEMSLMGKINFFLGLNIRQSSEGIFINQEDFTKTLLAKFGMVGDLKVKVPMVFGSKLTPSLYKPTTDITLYRQMIGSLLCLTSSRPDIMFDVCYCARYQANPREPHMVAVKNIFRYLKRTTSLGLWYSSGSGFFVQAFSDADLGGCGVDRKSTSGGCQFLDGKLIRWQSKKQTCVSLSTTEAEYIAAASCTSQIIWIQNQLIY